MAPRGFTLIWLPPQEAGALPFLSLSERDSADEDGAAWSLVYWYPEGIFWEKDRSRVEWWAPGGGLRLLPIWNLHWAPIFRGPWLFPLTWRESVSIRIKPGCPYLCVLFPEGRWEHLNRQVCLQSPWRRHLVGEIQTCNKAAAQLTLLIHISVVLPASGVTLNTCSVPPTWLHIANYILGWWPAQCHQVICLHIKLQSSNSVVLAQGGTRNGTEQNRKPRMHPYVCVLVVQLSHSFATRARLLCLWNSPGKNTGVGCHSLLQQIFPTQRSTLGLLYCRWILYHMSHQGSPYVEGKIQYLWRGHGNLMWEKIIFWPDGAGMTGSVNHGFSTGSIFRNF